MESKNLIAVSGLKKLRVAQILSVLASILAIVGAIAALSGAVVAGGGIMEDNESLALGALGVAGVGGVLTIAGLVLALISFVMEIVGLVKAGPAHSGYKIALYMVLGNIALGIAGFFIKEGTIVTTILQSISPILVFLTVYFVLHATIALLREKGDEAAAKRGTTLRTIYLVCTAVDLAGSLIILCPVLVDFGDIATMISSVVQLVALFKYISFLGHSVQTLGAECSTAK